MSEKPHLEGWVTVTDAAKLLTMSRQSCHTLISRGFLPTVRSVGHGVRPLLVIALSDVLNLVETRKAGSQ